MEVLFHSIVKYPNDGMVFLFRSVPLYSIPFHSIILHQSKHSLKVALKEWNRNIFGNVHENVRLSLSMVDQIQQEIASAGYSDELHEAEVKAQLDLQHALNYEEAFWKQKSKVDWFIHGDRNTAYFHKVAKIRSASKQMSMLKQGDQVLVDRQQIENHVIDFYTSLYASENCCTTND